MKISLGSNEACERQSLQEALGASGFEGGFKSKRRMYPSCIRRRFQIQTKDVPKLAFEGGFKFKMKDMPKLHSKEAKSQSKGAESKETCFPPNLSKCYFYLFSPFLTVSF